MSKSFLTGLLALVCLSLIVNECYACTPPPVIYIYDTPQHEPLSIFDDSYKLFIGAYCEENGPIEDWEWYWSPTTGVYETNEDDWAISGDTIPIISLIFCLIVSALLFIFR